MVKTGLALSKIHGIGLFTAEPVSKGTIVWRYDSRLDIRLTAEVIAGLAAPAREQILKYTYREKHSGLYVLCGDDARFFNHSNTPNCIDICGDGDDITVAARNIAAGEELTCDYSLFDLDLEEGKYHI